MEPQTEGRTEEKRERWNAQRGWSGGHKKGDMRQGFEQTKDGRKGRLGEGRRTK